MSTPLLTTKTYMPALRSPRVPRNRLIRELDQRLEHGCAATLISAPAGFGKTTLVTEWLDHVQADASKQNQAQIKIAWLSLESSDNELSRFLTYIIAALRQREESDASNWEKVLNLLQSPQPAPIEVILISLINEISEANEQIILVLDDYHLITSQSIHDALTFLLQHLPKSMHLVIATREDPLLPLAALRAKNQLAELRAADLRFTQAETAEFINHVMALDVSKEEIASLEDRTEGWITGLQLAAISMQGVEDTSNFVTSFTGSHRYILDYLIEEVLKRQTKTIRMFLYQTAVLDRLTGSLCDAMTGQKNGRQTLEYLDKSNLFIVALDEERRWYRYHHLFADLLRKQLHQSQPDQVPLLQRQASEWFEQNGFQEMALEHALTAQDYERAADLSEKAWQAMDGSFQSATWLGWVQKLPDHVLRNRPVLNTQYAWALLDSGELEASERKLRDAERWLNDPDDGNTIPDAPSGKMVVVDEEQFRTLPARIAVVRAQMAQTRGDSGETLKFAERALELTPENGLLRSQATVILGFSHWASGDLEKAARAMSDWITSMQKMGNIDFTIASTFALAEISIALGRLQEALDAYQRTFELASKHEKEGKRVIAHHHLGIAMLYLEMGNSEKAAFHFQEGEAYGEHSTLVDYRYRQSLAHAQFKQAEGDLEGALDHLTEAEARFVRNFALDIRPVNAQKASVYIRQGQLAKAWDWVNSSGITVDGELSYLREFEYITLARVLIADYRKNREKDFFQQALRLLERLLKAAEKQRRLGSVIEILVLLAMAYQAQNATPQALESLERALTLAEPQGYIRIFVNEGQPMQYLLQEAEKKGISPEYLGKLAAFFGKSKRGASNRQLLDPLSKREMDVLRLLATELSGPEIAGELSVSLPTVRTHIQNIYSKLGVNNRRSALRRAAELELL
jgi:LuxR family maltose regulon positive regulatory protein